MSADKKFGNAAAANKENIIGKDSKNESMDISLKTERERPINGENNDNVLPTNISDKRKPSENDDANGGELREGEAKELVNPPKGLGIPWGLSNVGNGGNTLPTNEALGEPWPLGWKISPPSAYSEPVRIDNPMHSKQRALERFEKSTLVNLQKESMNDVNVNDESTENDNIRKSDENKPKDKEKEKDKPTEKVKTVEKFEFLGNNLETEYECESWITQLEKIGYQLFSESEEESEDEDGKKYSAPSQNPTK
jgi:hypothetical protein